MKIMVLVEKDLTPNEIMESNIPGLRFEIVGPNRLGDSLFDFPQRKALGGDKDVVLVSQEIPEIITTRLFFIECGEFAKIIGRTPFRLIEAKIKKYIVDNLHRAILITEGQ
ncbi:hypothetical protein KPN8_135 [Klebsiella phage KPN8]|nr:hypothetical protein KPN8_135 [Klebsiella phage KPN8]